MSMLTQSDAAEAALSEVGCRDDSLAAVSIVQQPLIFAVGESVVGLAGVDGQGVVEMAMRWVAGAT